MPGSPRSDTHALSGHPLLWPPPTETDPLVGALRDLGAPEPSLGGRASPEGPGPDRPGRLSDNPILSHLVAGGYT